MFLGILQTFVGLIGGFFYGLVTTVIGIFQHLYEELVGRVLVYVKDRNAKAADSLITVFFRDEHARHASKQRHMRDGLIYPYTLVGKSVDLDAREITLFKAIVQAGNEWKEAYEQATANSSNLALPSRH